MNNKELIIEEFLKTATDTRETVSDIKCSACGEEEAYLYKKFPFSIYCPRKNNCGEVTKASGYFPHLVSTKREPLKPEEEEEAFKEQARHYVTVKRGVKEYEELGGEYCVLTMDGKQYPSLRFRLEDKKSFNYRVIGHPTKKAHFDYGKPIGDLLFIPNQEFSYEKIWIAESPLKAMALVSAGKSAVAMTSTSTNIKNSAFIKKALEINDNCVFVLALDNDEAGIKTTKKWFDKYKEQAEDFGMLLEVAIPPDKGVDWDDYLRRGNLDEKIKRGETLGLIFQCEDIAEVKKMYAQKVVKEDMPREQRISEWWPRLVEFNGMTWYIAHKEKRHDITYSSTLVLDGLFKSGYNYTIGDELNRETVTIAKIVNTKGTVFNVKLTAEDRVNPGALRKKLSDTSLLQYNPVYGTHDYIIKTLMRVDKTATVRHVERAGYDKESDCYVFSNFAIDPNGRYIKLNKLGFFSGINLHIAKGIVPKAFEPNYKSVFSHYKFLKLVHQAWGNNGIILMAYYLSAYFSYLKCSGIDGTYPFISFEGAPGTGKSTLISLLNIAFNFFASEGRPVNKTDTRKGVGRDLAKYSSLCIPLLESRKEREGRELLSEDMFLNLYGRNPAQTTAIKSMDLETRSVPFDAALIMVWNHNTFLTKEVRDRFINLKVEVESGKPLFNQSNQTAKNELKLAGYSISSIGLDVLRNREIFEARYLNKIENYKKALQEEGLSDVRYQDNFAHLLGVLDIYQDVFLSSGSTEEQEESKKIINRCILDLTEKAKVQSKETLGDAGLVKEFWEIFQQRLSGSSSGFDDSFKKGEHFVCENKVIYIRPKKVFDHLRWDKQDLDALKSGLQRSHLFRGTKSKRSSDWSLPDGQSPVCHTWAFELSFPMPIINKADSCREFV